MKVVLVLIFATFTGCNANLIYGDEPQPQLDMLTSAFFNFADAAQKAVRDFRNTEFGNYAIESLRDGAVSAQQRINSAYDALPDETKRGIEASLELAVSVKKGLRMAEKKLEPLVERLAPKVETVARELAHKAQQLASPVVEKLEPWIKDIQGRLETLYNAFYTTN